MDANPCGAPGFLGVPQFGAGIWTEQWEEEGCAEHQNLTKTPMGMGAAKWVGMPVLAYKIHFTLYQPSLHPAALQRASIPFLSSPPCSPAQGWREEPCSSSEGYDQPTSSSSFQRGVEREGTRSSWPGCHCHPPPPLFRSLFNHDCSPGAPQPPCPSPAFLLLPLPTSCGQGMRAQGTHLWGPARVPAGRLGCWGPQGLHGDRHSGMLFFPSLFPSR